MIHLAASFWAHDLWHPLRGLGYQFWSGIESAIERPLGWLGLGALYLRHHNCEHKGCWRPGHRHPDHGRPVCRAHYHRDVAPARGA